MLSVFAADVSHAALCAGTNAQGHLVVSALFLPFAEEIIDAAIADETKRAPEAPEEVTQIATQLEVAMAVQDQLTSKVQEIATDLKQKVSSPHLEVRLGAALTRGRGLDDLAPQP